MEQQQQPQQPQPVTFVPQQPYPYPAVQPMMMATPQQMPAVQYMAAQPGVQFVPVQQAGMPLPGQMVCQNKFIYNYI